MLLSGLNQFSNSFLNITWRVLKSLSHKLNRQLFARFYLKPNMVIKVIFGLGIGPRSFKVSLKMYSHLAVNEDIMQYPGFMYKNLSENPEK